MVEDDRYFECVLLTGHRLVEAWAKVSILMTEHPDDIWLVFSDLMKLRRRM
jgi:hypothetical protein